MGIPAQQVTAKELTSKVNLTAIYNERNANLFVGGYTVQGTKLSMSAGKTKMSGKRGPENFSVEQECICSAEATPNGIFARGANPENAFLFLATLNNKNDEWTAEQTSVGVDPPYKAKMFFGKTPGGPHKAVGSTLNSSNGVVVGFSADQSAMGCNEGGPGAASACEAVCGKFGLSREMIRQKCGL